MPVKSLKINSTGARIGLLSAGLFLIVCLFLFAKWELANAFAPKSEYKEVAEVAVNWAPSDPQAHLAWAILLEKTFLPDDLPKALIEYEKAAALSPNNYLLWLALGKARGRDGNAEGAEKALRKAQELAPNYAQIQWTLGNVLLREGKTDEGFAQIRRAAESDPHFTNPAVLAAWQMFEGDLAQTRRAVGDSPLINSALAVFLAKQNRLDEAFQVWESLPAENKKTDYKANGQELYNQFVAAKKYREAQRILAEISEAGSFTAGQFANGGFETDVKMQNAGLFEWQIADAPQPQIGYDNQQKHDGTRSLAIVFNSADGRDFRAVSQTVTVEPGKSYNFETFYKSDLKTNATVTWEIADAANGKMLATTEPSEAKTADWTKLQTRFTAAETEAVIVRLARVPCKAATCPIVGRILFDDFTLTKN